MTQVEEFLHYGQQLQTQLLDLAKEYNVRSDEYEILLWEADIVAAHLQSVQLGHEISETLQHSVLLSAWGKDTARHHPELAHFTQNFYQQFDLIYASQFLS
ncbi:hypothetical protein [Acinetobacter sp. MB5]|uniref:hypothetical protein n=1 Tax=Acinetobacter sp. MB5 TaxID=2069438 RepID=UPI000DCFD8CB|nr:hypothetical protein [Acinetobacter sp. MB5]